MDKKNRFQCFLSKLKHYNTVRPASYNFGLDRGKAIDRYYIEKFLFENRNLIRGVVVEVGGRAYSRKFGDQQITKSLVLHPNPEKRHVDIVANLETGKGIPENLADCLILTQTLLCIFDVQSAAENSIKILKPGGAILLTVPGITQISQYDYQRWGQYWSFTDQTIKRLFEKIVPSKNINIKTYGNVKVATSFLYGLALHEINKKTLDYHDPNYQLIISAVIKK